MKPVRLNTLVVDTSIFAQRPSPAELKDFFDKKLHLDMENVRRIQLHNIKNVVYLGMRDMLVAKRIAADHHLKHYMVIGGKEIPIPVPVYIESSATDVRLHDLPEEIDTKTIIEHMSQYGEVISIRDELWKNFWPGFSNGVTVVRMRLARHIPSFINFEEFDESASLVTYKTQVRTCFRCNRRSHPKQRCSEVAAAEKQSTRANESISTTTATNQATCELQPTLGPKAKKTSNDLAVGSATSSSEKETQLNKQAFPALPSVSPVPSVQALPPAPTEEIEIQSNNRSGTFKRQYSTEEPTANKKTNGSNSNNESRELFDSDSIDPQMIFEEMLSRCETNHIKGSEKKIRERLLSAAHKMADRNKQRLHNKV